MRDECGVLVAQYFLPLNVVAAQRALRIARAMLERYSRVYLITGDDESLPPDRLDREFGKEVLSDPRLIRQRVAPMLRGYGYTASPSAVQRLIGGAATRLLCGPGLDWLPGLRAALRQVPTGEAVAIAVATGPPFIPFRTVSGWARSRGIPLLLDYRDLWTTNPHARYPRLTRAIMNAAVERPVNERADVITTVSDGCRQILEDPANKRPVRVVYNSPDSSYLDHFRRASSGGSLPEGPSLRVVYAGQVYPNCTFAPLLRALKAMPPEAVSGIDVHYYGGSSALVRQEFEQFQLASRLTDHGNVSKDASIQAIAQADVLLSLIHADRTSNDPAVTGLMTTKVYDYLLSGNPILNIGPENAEVVHFARRVGYPPFQNVVADDLEGLTRFLQHARLHARTMKVKPLIVQLPDFGAAFAAAMEEAEQRGRRHP